jgi:hypothetical protein
MASPNNAIVEKKDLHVGGVGSSVSAGRAGIAPRADEPKRTFLNRRDWGSYLSALQSAATYPKVLEAVKSSRDWFTQGATQASNWLVGSGEWRDKFSAG